MINRFRQAFFSLPILGGGATQHPFNGPTLPTAIAANRSLATMAGSETATFANGCFWCVSFSSGVRDEGAETCVIYRGTQHLFDQCGSRSKVSSSPS